MGPVKVVSIVGWSVLIKCIRTYIPLNTDGTFGFARFTIQWYSVNVHYISMSSMCPYISFVCRVRFVHEFDTKQGMS